MVIDPKSLSPGAMYQFMISIVIPRPIAFVSTVSREGGFNVAPFSFYNALTGTPPLIGISINHRSGGPKDTLRNIRDTSEFVVNTVSEDLAGRMVQASGEWPSDVDEFRLTGLTPVPSELVKAPRVAESPIHFECKLYREVELGKTTFVVGEILRGHADDSVLTEGRVDPLKLRPVGRLGGDGYSIVRELLRMPRPVVEKRSA